MNIVGSDHLLEVGMYLETVDGQGNRVLGKVVAHNPETNTWTIEVCEFLQTNPSKNAF